MSPLAHVLSASPELFPAAIDLATDTLTLWHLTRNDYAEAAFLDGRIAPGKPARRIGFFEVSQAVGQAGLPERCQFIFHLGHVGSTLVSRLLGRHQALFSVREPDILRTLATAPPDQRDRYLGTCLKLLSRAFEPAQVVVVKTTSFVSEIAVELLSCPYHPQAVLMGVPPEVYLATIFGGANAPAEAHALAAFRIARLNRRLRTEWLVEDLGQGEVVALGWACEALCLAEAAQNAKARVLVLDFEKFLNDVHQGLRTVLFHFGVVPGEAELSEMLRGPELYTYSKDASYPYSGETRRAVLAQGRARHADAIREGLRWIERAAAQHASLRAGLSLFG